MKFPEISVVVPCFNEGKTIRQNISKIHSFLSNNFEKFEIIAVNDGSKDDTAIELAKAQQELGFLVINQEQNKGKGSAVKSGMLIAKFEYILFLDADLAIPIEELNKFYLQSQAGFDLVIASRFVPGLKILKPTPLHRKIMEKVFRLMRMLIINNATIQDTQCGFKLFSQKAAGKIFPSLTVERFAFDSEIIFLASKFGFKIKELPISLQNPRESHVRIFRDPLNMTADLIKIRFNDFLGKYKNKPTPSHTL